LSGTLASADDARLQIIDQFADPLVLGTNSPLATASVGDRTDATNWQTLSVNWTNTGTLRRLVWIRTIMRSATVTVAFAEGKDIEDYPDAANTLSADTTNGVAGTFVEADRNTDPGVANVWKGSGTYKIANATKTPTKTAASLVVTNGDAATLTAPDIKLNVIVDPGADQITGSAAGGGSVIVIED